MKTTAKSEKIWIARLTGKLNKQLNLLSFIFQDCVECTSSVSIHKYGKIEFIKLKGP